MQGMREEEIRDDDCDCTEVEIPAGAVYGEFQIVNKKGLHARATAKFVQCASQFDAAASAEEAKEIMWQLERLIATDKPHVPLFDTGILEFYSNNVQFPFTETLSGLQNIYGSPGTVTSK